MGEALKLGIVGCGNHMFEFLFHALKWAPEHTVVAACDIDAKRLDRFTRLYNVAAGYTDLAEMLAEQKPDAIIVSVGHAQNFAIAKAALEAGAHVFLEKTPCRNVAEAEELAAIVRRTGKSLMVGFNRRFMTAYVMAHEISRRPEFGGIRMYHSQFHATPYRSDEHLRTNHIIHHLDLARFLMGELTLTHVDRLVIDDRRIGYNINFVAEGGGIGVVQCGSFLDELYPMERLELLGDRRNIVVDNIKGLVYNRPPVTRKETFGQFTLADEGDALVWNPSHGYYPRFSHHGYENELHYFLKCIGTGATPLPGIEDSGKTMDLLAQLDALLAAKGK